MKPLLIIGTGLSGYTLAKEFRKLDTQTPIHFFTRDEGDYYSKPLLSTALSQKKTAKTLKIMTADEMAKQLNATIHTQCEVTSIDLKAKTITANNKTYAYSKLVLAWGAKANDAKLKGTAAQDALSVNNLADYIKFRQLVDHKKRITILGSGLVGCEFANDLASAEYDVNVISRSPTPLSKILPSDVGSALAAGLTQPHLHWHWASTITEVDKQQDGSILITLNSGKQFSTDILLTAIGIKPQVALAQQAGLKVKHGIIVDAYLQTSDPNVYSLGDCAEVCGHSLQHIAPLMQSAKVLAKTLHGDKTAVQYPAMPVVVKTPFCPVVASPPHDEAKGDWKIEGAGSHIRAMYLDQSDNLHGYALIGDRVKERQGLTTLLPPLLQNDPGR